MRAPFVILGLCLGTAVSAPVTADHWAYQTVTRPAVPAGDWGDGAIDRFVGAAMAERRLSPSPRADRRTLIRRLYLVVHGLPPTPEEVEAFVADDSPDAWPKLVDRALASPRFGERFARHWLDIVRFAETNGFETNRERPTAYHFRDYVIRAFNEDKPYDQFVREQLAGDALGTPVGTGFLVAGTHDIVKSPDVNLTLMQREDELADMINTTGTAFLGITLGCARCHSHKFDPVTQTDYYALAAVFAGVKHGEGNLPEESEGGADGLRAAVDARGNVERFDGVDTKFLRFEIRATNGGEPCIDELEAFDTEGRNVALASAGTTVTSSGDLPGYAIHKLEHINDGRYGNGRSWISNQKGKGWVRLEFPRSVRITRIAWARDREGKYRDRLPTDYTISASPDGKTWQQVASSADRRTSGGIRKAWIGTFSQPGPTHRLHRGDPMEKREVVDPDAIEVFGSLGMSADEPERQRRVKLASWIASEDNPLTARVMVNRLWQFTFGVGIVDTPSDFGGNGNPPTHPQLLDWLAAEFVEDGWSVKHLLRLMLNSQTFLQSSFPRPEAAKIDADSRYLWRFPPRRLEAEAIRDSVLAVAGTLDLKMGGPGFYLHDVDRENVVHYHPKEETGPAEWRRMVYLFKIRQEQDSVFGAFDCPDGGQVIPKRSRSTTPLQALNLFNSRFMITQADKLAERVKDEGAWTIRAYALLYGREPTPAELEDADRFIAVHGLQAFCRAMLNTNEFLFVF